MAQLGANTSVEAETLSHVLSLMQAFQAFDSDNDGCINEAELAGIMGSLGYKITDQEVRAMMSQADTNRDGQLSLAEYLELNTKDMEPGSLATLLKSAFESIDADGDDVITGEELFQAMRDMGVGGFSFESCQQIISSMDGDGDGAVTSQELKLLIDALL
uniref:EF-hand domain-containing protein n=1 Tax=Opuntia streptacantha TaxID=393608 RepID=A0A7C9DW68_OPUST